MQSVLRRTRARLRRLIPAVVVLGLLTSGAVVVTSTPALADTCGQVMLAGSAWLNGGGVNVHSNAQDGQSYGDNDCASPAEVYNLNASPPQYGDGWQCVELVNRLYMTKGWISSYWNGNGSSLINPSNLPSGMTVETQNNVTSVVPGDVYTLSYSTFGHAAVVNTVTPIGGGTYQLQIVNQNAPDVYGYAEWNSNAGTVTSEYPGYSFQAIVHSSANTATDGGGGSGPTETYVQSEASVNYNGDLDVLYPGTNPVSGKVDLRFASYNGSSWSFTNLDGDSGSISGQQGTYYALPSHATVSAVVYNSTLQVFYTLANGDIRNASYNGTSWSFQNLDGDSGSVAGQQSNNMTDVGSSIASVVDSNNVLQLFYTGIDSTGYNDLRHAWYNGTSWNFESLDGSPGSIAGQYSTNLINAGNSVRALMYGTTLEVFYQGMDPNSGVIDLRQAWTSPSNGWQFENLDGDSGSLAGSGHASSVGSFATAVVDGSSIQLFYTSNYGQGDLRHAWSSNGTSWSFENLDGDSGSIAGQYSTYSTAPGNSVQAIMWGGTLEVFYEGTVSGKQVLRHAWTGSSGWQFENFDGTSSTNAGNAGNYTTNPGNSFTDVIDGSGDLQMFYQGTTTGGSVDIRHIWVTSSSPWYFTNLDGDSGSIAGGLGVNFTNAG